MRDKRSSIFVGIFGFLALLFLDLSASANSANSVSGGASRRPYAPLGLGQYHGCAIQSGSVYCWGYNGYGEVGNGTTTTPVTTPAQVSGTSKAVEVSAGAYHSCALQTNGTVYCWGYGAFGSLGQGSSSSSSTAVQVSGLSNVASISAGGYHTCAAVAGGAAQCWGYNASGQLGNSSTTDSNTPVSVSGLSGSYVVSVVTGQSHTCALLGNGNVTCWGDNTYGQLGDGTSVTSRTSPSTTVAFGTGKYATAIASAGYHTCALMAGGSVTCWGYNGYGALGNNSTTTSNVPVTVLGTSGTGTLSNIVSLGVGQYQSLAVDSSGSTYSWGYNGSGQLGDGTTTNRLYPVNITAKGVLGETALVSSGYSHSCSLTDKGALQCWGDNTYGQFGNGNTTSSTTPVNTSIGQGSVNVFAQASFGENYGCGISPSGTLKCWGWNYYGQLGNGTTTSQDLPVSVSLSGTPLQVATSVKHTCAVIRGGTVQCWGNNARGQLGNSSTTNSSTPVTVTGLTNAVSVSVGLYFSCALTGSGAVQCWGDDSYWQTSGTSSGGYYTSPTTVSVGYTAIALTLGDWYACALLLDHTISCWGATYLGELGTGQPTTPAAGPARTNSLRTLAVGLSARAKSTCALLQDGSAQCWGQNLIGQFPILGTSTFSQGVYSPTDVSNSLSNQAIALNLNGAGGTALLANGTMLAWGINQNGTSLGVGGTVAGQSTPAAVKIGATDFIRLIGSGFANGGYYQNGNILLMGTDAVDVGLLGNGSNVSVVPTAISNFP